MLFIIGLFALAPFVVGVITAVDASHLPDWAFERAGTSKTLWIVLPLVSLVACFLGSVVVALVWFAGTRNRVVAAASQALPPASPPPPGGGWQPPSPSQPW
jgi:hypothetical protein